MSHASLYLQGNVNRGDLCWRGQYSLSIFYISSLKRCAQTIFFFISVWEYRVTILNVDKLTLQLVRYLWSYLLNDYVFQSKKKKKKKKHLLHWFSKQQSWNHIFDSPTRDPIVLYFLCLLYMVFYVLWIYYLHSKLAENWNCMNYKCR